jgi:hypothetical protein
MTRSAQHRIAWTSATCALALAAVFGASGGASTLAHGKAPEARPLSLVEALTLLRWGAGALDWMLPEAKHPKGESDARVRDHRA